ncbi:hypothetical protein [Candidatus Leptofilum sp.]|uniref:hypothetical protein n=1 Tax=Candidatus Leptofilum sp. TaxID=3241576 RepID=UPI003B5B191C
MIKTETTWNDSGYDCDHCGGQILKRTDVETGQPARVCYQCQACGCQWQLSGDVMRIGNLNSCRRAQRVRAKSQVQTGIDPIKLRLIVVGTVLFLGAMVLVGGLTAIRFLVPIGLAAFVFWTIYQMGKERMWW